MAFLHSYFAGTSHVDGTEDLDLRVSLSAFARGLSFEKCVAVQVRYLTNHRCSDTLHIAWSAPDTQAFPHFAGRFVASDEKDVDCRLTLTGSYAAPGGLAGGIFDAALGARIARATIGELLERLAAAAESDYLVRSAM